MVEFLFYFSHSEECEIKKQTNGQTNRIKHKKSGTPGMNLGKLKRQRAATPAAATASRYSRAAQLAPSFLAAAPW